MIQLSLAVTLLLPYFLLTSGGAGAVLSGCLAADFGLLAVLPRWIQREQNAGCRSNLQNAGLCLKLAAIPLLAGLLLVLAVL